MVIRELKQAYRYIPENMQQDIDKLNKQFPVGSIVKWMPNDSIYYRFGIVAKGAEFEDIVPYIYIRTIDCDGNKFSYIDKLIVDERFNSIYNSSFEEFVNFYVSLAEERIKNARDTIKWSHQSISNEQRYIRKMKKLLKEQTHGERE